MSQKHMLNSSNHVHIWRRHRSPTPVKYERDIEQYLDVLKNGENNGSEENYSVTTTPSPFTNVNDAVA